MENKKIISYQNNNENIIYFSRSKNIVWGILLIFVAFFFEFLPLLIIPEPINNFFVLKIKNIADSFHEGEWIMFIVSLGFELLSVLLLISGLRLIVKKKGVFVKLEENGFYYNRDVAK